MYLDKRCEERSCMGKTFGREIFIFLRTDFGSFTCGGDHQALYGKQLKDNKHKCMFI